MFWDKGGLIKHCRDVTYSQGDYGDPGPGCEAAYNNALAKVRNDEAHAKSLLSQMGMDQATLTVGEYPGACDPYLQWPQPCQHLQFRSPKLNFVFDHYYREVTGGDSRVDRGCSSLPIDDQGPYGDDAIAPMNNYEENCSAYNGKTWDADVFEPAVDSTQSPWIRALSITYAGNRTLGQVEVRGYGPKKDGYGTLDCDSN